MVSTRGNRLRWHAPHQRERQGIRSFYYTDRAQSLPVYKAAQRITSEFKPTASRFLLRRLTRQVSEE